MMNVKSELQLNKIAFAALLLGALTLSPYAKAADEAQLPPATAAEADLPSATRNGMKWSELRQAGSIQVKIENDMIVLSGAMPRECAKGRVMSEVESGEGKHKIKIDLPNCRNGYGHLTAAQQKDLVQVKAALPPKGFDASQDGEFCLTHSTNNDGEQGCDSITVAGKPLKHESLATVASRREEAERKEREKQEREQREARRKQREADERLLVTKIGDLCKAGDFLTISKELEAASEWLGDLTKILNELANAKVKSLEAQLRRATSPEDAKTAYEGLVGEGTYGAEKALELYGNKRVELLKKAVEDKAQTVSALQSVISEFESDLLEAGAGDKEVKESVVWAHTALGNRLRDEKDYSGAESQYEKALRHATLDGKIKIEQEMAKMFLAAAEACLEENKTKPAKCDALAKKARKHMDGAIALQGRKRGDDSAEELAGMKMEKIQTFGVDGINMKMQGYGSFNPYGGAYDQRKRQMYQTGMQEEYMKRIMQMQMGGQGAGMMNNGNGSFFR